MSYEITSTSFSSVSSGSVAGHEGLVLLGCGGDLREWVNGVTEMLFNEGICESKVPEEVWGGFQTLTSTGGRHDLVLWFSDKPTLKIGALAMWRLMFGDASWVSDFVVNYKDHYIEA